MAHVLRSLYLLALVAWIGAIIFFSFVAAPSIFAAVPVEVAGKVVARIFPRYYLLGFGAGIVALVAFLGLGALSRDWGVLRVCNALLLAAMLGTGLYAGTVVQGQVNEARRRMEEVGDRSLVPADLRATFDRGHRLSVILNAIVLVLGLVVVVITATHLRL
jgi:hypothetical protein